MFDVTHVGGDCQRQTGRLSRQASLLSNVGAGLARDSGVSDTVAVSDTPLSQASQLPHLIQGGLEICIRRRASSLRPAPSPNPHSPAIAASAPLAMCAAPATPPSAPSPHPDNSEPRQITVHPALSAANPAVAPSYLPPRARRVKPGCGSGPRPLQIRPWLGTQAPAVEDRQVYQGPQSPVGTGNCR